MRRALQLSAKSEPPSLPATEPVGSGTDLMRIFASTPLYVQGPGALAAVGGIAARMGHRPTIVIDAQLRGLLIDKLQAGFALPARFIDFSGEVTDASISQLAQASAMSDVIVAAGGGKVLDAGKAVAFQLGLPVISAPTIASNDGPASRGIAIYDDSHRLVRVDQMPTNPAAVVVDTLVIARAPARFLRAGIGDAIAKTFEAEACWAGTGLNKHGTRSTHSARAIALAAYHMLREHAADGLRAVERREVTEALEATVEACILLSAMGFENGGLSIAHSVTRGLMTLRGARHRLHGEHVAYGTLVQLAVEERTEDLADLAGFLHQLGLPVSLAALDVDSVTFEEITAIAADAMTSPHMASFAYPLGPIVIERAIRHVEAHAARHLAQRTHI